MVIALIVVLAAIRVKREDLAGAQTQLSSPAGDAVTREDARGRVSVTGYQAMAGGIFPPAIVRCAGPGLRELHGGGPGPGPTPLTPG